MVANHITIFPKEFRDKLAPKSKKCIFLGYGDSSEMGYWLWEPKGKRIMHINDVYFNEEKFHKKLTLVIQIRRVIFQEDGHVHEVGHAQNGHQQAPIAPMQDQAIVNGGDRVEQQAIEA